MKNIAVSFAIVAPVFFAACENPADKTASAAVSEVVVKSADSPAAEGVRYVFLPGSGIHFVGSKVTGSHEGGFKEFTGHFTIADGEPVGTDHRVVIDMDSTWSDSERLTGHLKNADFFDVEKFPTSTFEATSIEKLGEGSYRVAGNFTLHGVTKNIAFPVTVTGNGPEVEIGAKFDINRKDFGIVYSGKTDDLIRDEVVIELKLKAAPEPAQAAAAGTPPTEI